MSFGPLYTAEVKPRERVYACAACGAETVLGENGAPATIEVLKEKVCVKCGGKVFRRRAGVWRTGQSAGRRSSGSSGTAVP